jgi:cysteine desulfurase/selenocysteine lyase
VGYRLARFDSATGGLDLDHLGSLIDARTKLVCVTGASDFLGTRTPLAAIRALADESGYVQPGGERGSRLLVDGYALPVIARCYMEAHGSGLSDHAAILAAWG